MFKDGRQFLSRAQQRRTAKARSLHASFATPPTAARQPNDGIASHTSQNVLESEPAENNAAGEEFSSECEREVDANDDHDLTPLLSEGFASLCISHQSNLMLPKNTPISVLPTSEVIPPAQDSTPKRSGQTLEADNETDSAIPITFLETPVTHKNIVMRANRPLTPYHFSEYMGARFSDEFGDGNVESSTDEWANSSTYRTAFHLKLITRHMSLIEVDSFHNHLERLQTMEDLENQRAWTDEVLENQTEIEPIHLMISFAWIAEECYLQNWSHITYQSAVLYMYSYLVRGERFPSSDLQCLAATALMIAIKVNESCTISPLAYLSHFGNPDETSLKMKDFEHKFLFAVNDSRSCCPSTVVTPYEWYMAYCQLYQVWRGHRSLDQSHLLEFTWQRGLKVLDAAVMDPRSQKQTPSALAAAMFVLCENPKSNSLLHCTGYCLEQLEHAMKFIRYFEMQWFGEDGFVENQVYLSGTFDYKKTKPILSVERLEMKLSTSTI